MQTFWLHIQAPFAAFRTFQAGAYRSSSSVIPYSAAYGLLLNLAGIEMRADSDSPTTLIRGDLPSLKIATGRAQSINSEKAILYQQLHVYPVGTSGKLLKNFTHGAKYWITPARREMLVTFECFLGVQAEENIADRVKAGLEGTGDWIRYGLPFAGDNNLLFDRIDFVDGPGPAHWLVPVGPDDFEIRDSSRLTIGIDRADNSRTTSELFTELKEAQVHPPENSWIWTPKVPTPIGSPRD